MNTNLLATIYAMLLHLLAIVALVVLISNGSIDQATGLPILAGLLGLGAGAGVALIQPGQPSLPSGPPAQLPTAASVTPAAPQIPAGAPVGPDGQPVAPASTTGG